MSKFPHLYRCERSLCAPGTVSPLLSFAGRWAKRRSLCKAHSAGSKQGRLHLQREELSPGKTILC
ncbi:MAG: hypothetical protein HC895_21490 [Leptolyngbyaceae cyanobacterium SM1_3_5]|nr:hypothetical protein [Leptolyngbyaceae cyanobacterium SM1_3_5]